ncbi:MAG: FAD-binding protein, partial [Burkholderiales bacterium]|nr:FAD-binding protein [Burkholderiales bacterium]
MALRAGLTLRDMEMVQFHPTGLIAGPHTRITGTIIEEGLRGAGGQLLNGAGERFMHLYDEREERATRDIVSRGMYYQMREGNVGPRGGLYITMRHLDPVMVRKMFKGMVERCADCGFDLVSGLVDVVPTAHYMMGGVVFSTDCSTDLSGLFAAGEDSGGVHGANRLGGNGVANSTVFGGIAGDAMPRWLKAGGGGFHEPDPAAIDEAVARCEPKQAGRHGSLEPIRERLYEVMWDKVGIIRDAEGMQAALSELGAIEAELAATGIADANRAFNLTWHDWMNLRCLTQVSQVITRAALARTDSRGAHYREDFPQAGALETSAFTSAREENGRLEIAMKPVAFTRVKPGQSLLRNAA